MFYQAEYEIRKGSAPSIAWCENYRAQDFYQKPGHDQTGVVAYAGQDKVFNTVWGWRSDSLPQEEVEAWEILYPDLPKTSTYIGDEYIADAAIIPLGFNFWVNPNGTPVTAYMSCGGNFCMVNWAGHAEGRAKISVLARRHWLHEPEPMQMLGYFMAKHPLKIFHYLSKRTDRSPWEYGLSANSE